ncbi:MAG: hypothetical protein CM1200mP23_4890 [Nitrososphaerota archaeon]|nr:MAG: hypothetical protein CM1200mP23_4890 [Nitrososphaerota archaeon]
MTLAFFVRHEAAIALGVVGSKSEKGKTLEKALNDPDEPVRGLCSCCTV